MTFQAEEIAKPVSALMEHAPAIGAVVLVSLVFGGGFVRYLVWERRLRSKESQEHAERIEARHTRWFTQHEEAQRVATTAIQENTRVLGEVAATNQDVKQALRDLRAPRPLHESDPRYERGDPLR